MKKLNKTEMLTVSGGAIGLDDVVNLWAGYHHWDHRTVITYNAIGGGIVGAIACLPIMPIGFIGGAAIAALNSAIFYKIGSVVAALDKESSSAHA